MLVPRFLDGSIDMLDQFMAASVPKHSTYTGSTNVQQPCVSAQQPETPCMNLPALEQHNGLQPHDNSHTSATSGQHTVAKIAVLHKDDLSYQQFVEKFMQPNLPVMIQV